MDLSRGRHSRTVLLGIFLLLAILQAWLNRSIAETGLAWVEPPSGGEKWDPKVVQLFSFGNLPVAIDWILIQALADIDMNRVLPGTHSGLYQRLDLVSDLDPPYFDVYQIAGDLLTVLQNDGLGAKSILMKGHSFIREKLPYAEEGIRTQYWGHPWKLLILLAYTYLFHLNDMSHASEAFQEAASYPGAPDYLIRLEHRLKRPGGEYEVGIKLLGFMMESSRDQKSRAVLEQKRKDLFIAQYVFELNQSFLNYLKLQPLYNSSGSISKHQMEVYFKEFLRRNQIPQSDPWGGSIKIDDKGRVVSTTPYQPVFGLR